MEMPTSKEPGHCPLISLKSWPKTAHEYLDKRPTNQTLRQVAGHRYGSIDSCFSHGLLHSTNDHT